MMQTSNILIQKSLTDGTKRYKAINIRITLDLAVANPAKFVKKALSPDLIKRTWSGILQDEKDLPKGHFNS